MRSGTTGPVSRGQILRRDGDKEKTISLFRTHAQVMPDLLNVMTMYTHNHKRAHARTHTGDYRSE